MRIPIGRYLTRELVATGRRDGSDGRLLSQMLVACNVYVSAGGGGKNRNQHAKVLSKLLADAQANCRRLSTRHHGQPSASDDTSTVRARGVTVVVVHAYADPIYDRSSFHLAGSADRVAVVASDLATSAIRYLRQAAANGGENDQSDLSDNTDRSHPSVGLVDHIAVMPLIGSDDHETDSSVLGKKTPSKPDQQDDHDHDSASGWAARQIGRAMMTAATSISLQVLYYGSAPPSRKPLAEVRRERTNFFQSGGLSLASTDKKGTASQRKSSRQQVATVGAPLYFAENYNIRLSNRCSKRVAQTLTRFVRERDGGLPGVEALTLPYSHGRWEVACNLLRPDLASADDVQARVELWERHQLEQELGEDGSASDDTRSFVEFGYRVGTTVEQCLQALLITSRSLQERQNHDKAVMKGLQARIDTPIEKQRF